MLNEVETECPHKEWHNGDCCCNCANLIELRCRPGNQNFAKDSISDLAGYVCVAFSDESIGVFSESKHGMCECHRPKKIETSTSNS